jgi:hypothetical protein
VAVTHSNDWRFAVEAVAPTHSAIGPMEDQLLNLAFLINNQSNHGSESSRGR